MDRCIFCEIVAGRAPASVVYEDETVMAFMDLHPVNPGHLLVIPKQHWRNIFDCLPEVAGKIMTVAAQLAAPLRAATNAEGLNIFMANEAVAGQEVWHIHLHLLPRHRGDGFGLRLPPDGQRRVTRSQLDEMAAAIRKQLPKEV